MNHTAYMGEHHIAYRLTKMRIGSVINLEVISSISWGKVAEMSTTCVAGGK